MKTTYTKEELRILMEMRLFSRQQDEDRREVMYGLVNKSYNYERGYKAAFSELLEILK